MRKRLYISSLLVLVSIILFGTQTAFSAESMANPHGTGNSADCKMCHSPAPQVEFFSPQGTIKNVRQVSVRFSAQMVPFGNPSLSDPFDINCTGIGNITGKGRWADGNNWEYDFKEDLPAGVKCQLALKPGLKDISGIELSGQKTFAFSTGGPAIINNNPWNGSTISEDQIFILSTDAPTKEESVLSHAYFRIEGINGPVGVDIIKGELRKQLLKATGYDFQSYPYVTLIKCRLDFPNHRKVDLVWGKGVETANGIATTQDQVIHFESRRAFTARFSCSRENKSSLCIPLLPMEVDFTGSISAGQAKKAVLIDQTAGKTYHPDVDANERYVNSIQFDGPFPQKHQFRIELPPDIKDDSGRMLVNKDKYPLTVWTGPYPSLAKFAAGFGIIEKDSPYLPVTVRNIEAQIKTRMLEIHPGATGEKGSVKGPDIKSKLMGRLVRFDNETEILKYMRLVKGKQQSADYYMEPGVTDPRSVPLLKLSGTRQFEMPKSNGEKAFEVIGVPLGKPGFYVVEIESLLLGKSLLGKPEPLYVSSAALVTGLSVHFERGAENSLVWVTSLEKAKPVKGANISITDCTGKVYWRGITGPDGTALIKKSVKDLAPSLPVCGSGDSSQSGLYVFARTRNDMSFVSSNWNNGIEPWRFQIPTADSYYPAYTNIAAHTIFDRPLFRAGETVHMKHIIRKRTGKGFEMVPETQLPKSAEIDQEDSDQKYTLPLKWDTANGVAESTWQIPKDAKLGSYTVYLTTGKKGAKYETGSFMVQEFKVPLMSASIQPVTAPLVNATSAALDVQVNYLSGGSAQGLPVKLRYQAWHNFPSGFVENYKKFKFKSGEVKEGIFRGGWGQQEYQGEYGQQNSPEKKIKVVELNLGSGGTARAHLSGLPAKPWPQQLKAELEYRDPNGIIQTVSRNIELWPSHIVLGIGPRSWQAANRAAAGFRLIALDLKGKPVPGVHVSANVYQRNIYSHRKRLVGGFYSYENVTEVKKIGHICDGITDSRGLVTCNKPAPAEGNLIIEATAKDDAGNLSEANTDIWVYGKEGQWFQTEDSDRIDVVPEKKQYEPGEKARLQVRMPFREATALVTVEREGVLDKYVVNISAKNPEIEVPIKKNYAPNVFISVLCVRGRVGAPAPTAMLDLGKPAYKLGIGEINVGWRENRLNVKVATDHQVYKVRQKAKVHISVKLPDGKPDRGGEVAVAAVDQGLLELMKNDSWDLLKDMMGERPYQVQTSTAQMQVVGKRHYGLKALPSGGGGGRLPTRELFNTLLFWKGVVRLDNKGEATVEVPLNDSLTSFDIVAVANSGVDKFGTGQTEISTSQDLMLFAGLPAMVREGDRFTAAFTVRNASSRPMEIAVSGSYGQQKEKLKLPEIIEKLAPGQAKDTAWNIKVPIGAENLNWQVAASEVNGTAHDSIAVRQKVNEAVPVRTFQATIFQLDKGFNMQVEKPASAIPGRGGIKISLASSITGGLNGVTEYMNFYPYDCMEQQVSKAIALKSDALWKNIVNELPSYMDGNGLVKYFPSMFEGSETLTAYILSISNEAGRQLPAAIEQKMEQGLAAFLNGSIERYSPFSVPDLTFRKLAAAEALSRHGGLRPDMLDSIIVDPNLWPTSAVLDWINILKRVPNMPDRSNRLDQAEQIIRSRLNFQGTVMTFSTEKTDDLWWLMESGDENAIRVILTFLNSPEWKQDMPRLVRGAVARQYKGHWITTTANAWGVVALDKFAQKFEAVRPSGQTDASLSGKDKTFNWAKRPQGGDINFQWPVAVAKKNVLSLVHQGAGRPWATIQSIAAVPLKAPISTGFRVKKTLIPVVQKIKGKWSVGDVIRVRLDMDAQSDMTWVAVNDPIPAGANILGIGLNRDSQLLTEGEQLDSGYVWPVYEEKSFSAYRAYFDYVPKGKWSIEYTIRLNNEGVFQMPPTRVEALYSPEMFGESPNGDFRIEP